MGGRRAGHTNLWAPCAGPLRTITAYHLLPTVYRYSCLSPRHSLGFPSFEIHT